MGGGDIGPGGYPVGYPIGGYPAGGIAGPGGGALYPYG